MRKLLFLFLVLSHFLTMTAGNEVIIDGIKYDLMTKTKTASVISGGNYSGDIVIPSSVNYYGVTYTITKIGHGAFQNCASLTSVQMPTSISQIGDYAFSGCTSLISTNLPTNIFSIGSYVFNNCISLTSITIPDNVLVIGAYAFCGCSNLTSVIIPNGVTEIRDQAFFGCSSITAIAIPQNVRLIGERAFGGCTNLTSITVASENTTYDSRYNCNAIIEISSKTLIVGCKNTKIPSYNVTQIGNNAFYNCSSLTSITIPENITTIGSNAFSGCSGLKIIEIPNSCETIDYNAFRDCSKLKIVDIGNGVTGIGDYAFAHCSELTYVTCRATSVPSTSNHAFDNLPMEEITLIVPSNYVDKYKAKAPWSNFGNFLPLSTANIVVMADDYTREYGETNPTFGYIANSLLEGTPTLTCSASETSSPGIYPIKVSKGSITCLLYTSDAADE